MLLKIFFEFIEKGQNVDHSFFRKRIN